MFSPLEVAMRFLLAVVFCTCCASGAEVEISVVSAGGSPLKDVLVILQTLESSDREICRSLTDAQGNACRTEVTPGLYRAIAATPYGAWETTLREFLAKGPATQVTLKMPHRRPGRHAPEIDDGGDRVNMSSEGLCSGPELDPSETVGRGDSVTVVDSCGLPLGAALVVLQTRDGKREFCRSMTDAQGHACRTDALDGPYRAIATTPYGMWNTAVLESRTTDSPARLRLKMTPRPTHGYGDIVPVGRKQETEIRVLRDKRPASNADVLVRDRGATLFLEHFYHADSSGKVRITLVGQPTVVVVIFGDVLVSEEIYQSLAQGQSDSVTIRLPVTQ